MCAINGYTWKDEKLLARMNARTKHRGPDGTGKYIDEYVSLGHNRLSIIDLSERANQPMGGASEHFIISYNGELYNFRELRRELESYPFKTESDTEVILAAWEKWGVDALPKFNGMFALALWDTEKQELFLARDRSGVKPLYYSLVSPERIIFSSEIKAILEYDIPRVLDKTAFSHYIRLLYVPGEQTLFQGIKRLKAGSFLHFKKGQGAVLHDFFVRTPQRGRIQSYKEAKESVRSTVEGAVQRQLISDKPLGVYLSGGIDSSAILASVLKARKRVDTFSVGFDVVQEEESEKFNADFVLARKTAQELGSNHHEILLSVDDVVERLPQVAFYLDQPVANPTSVAQLVLAGYAKKKVDVVLSGDGGDELFGGYERYRLSLLASYYKRFPQFVRIPLSYFDKFKKLNTSADVERFELFAFQKNNALSRVIEGEVTADTEDYFKARYFSENKWATYEDLLMDVDRQSWLVDESLIRTDQFAMAYGLEGRVPFLDNEVIDLAGSLPLKYKVTPLATKKILKDAFQGHIPDFLFDQPKRGWFSPAAKWLRRPELHTFAKEVLSSSYYRETTSLFTWSEIEAVLEEHHHHKSYHLHMIWMIMMFQLWAREYRVNLP